MNTLSIFEKDSMWNDSMTDDFIQRQRSLSEGGLQLNRLLAQTYSCSSDSSASPFGNVSRLLSPQVSNNSSGVFSFSDDNPLSSDSVSSRQTFNYSSTSKSYPSRNPRISSISESGPSTLDDALMMGLLSDTVSSKMKDLNISDLMTLCNNNNLLPKLSTSSSNNNNNAYGLNLGMSRNSLQSGLPSTQSLNQGLDFDEQLQNMWLTSQLLPNTVDSSNPFGGVGDLRNFPTSPPSLSSLFSGSDPYAIEKAARMHRSAAALCDATCTWSGPLPSKVNKNPFYSCKVFLGGVPWDVTELALRQAFLLFGTIQVEWPGKEMSANPPKGYVYILFENEKQVKALLAACTQDLNSENYYFKISSRRMRQKEVQVIPWIISDSNYVRCPSYQLDPAKTVFVGALHGMMSAEGIATIMNDLFGGVVYSGIDTDKHKYPIGSGRVTFNNVQSYKKAVRAAFVEIKTSKFSKKVQIDPYLADSPCQLCGGQHGPYFCRNEDCFKYYCRTCWQIAHSGGLNTHKPLMRDPKLRNKPVRLI